MKRLLCVILCLLLLVIPVFAEPSGQAQITSYDAVCTVDSQGACDVTLTVSASFPENATSFMLPLPMKAEQITTPGLSSSVTRAEDRVFLLVENSAGFSSAEPITVSYHLPQIVEGWGKKQTLTLPLLFDDWNCRIDFYQLQLDLPKEFDEDPLIYDEDGDAVGDFVTVSAEGSRLKLETGGKPFVPETATLEIEFDSDFFALPDVSSDDGNSDVTQINALNAACTVLNDSSCTVSLKAEFNFCGQLTDVQIPVPQDAYDIILGGMQYTEKEVGDCKLLVVENPAGFSGTQSFDLTYRMLTTASENGESQQFFLPLIYSQWKYRIRSFSLTLTLPSAFEGLPEFLSSYYKDQIDNYLDIRVDNQRILANSLQPLMEQESLSVRLDLPADFFDLRYLQGRFSSVGTVLFWLFAALCVLYWFFFLRTQIREVVPQARAPLGCNAGQIPYLLRLKTPSLGLLIMTWATLGYLYLERTKTRHLFLMRRMDMKNERSRCEAGLFSELFNRKAECRVQSRAYQNAANRCDKLTKDDWSDRLIHRKFGMAWPLKALGLLAAAAACLMAFDRLVTPQSFRWLVIVPLVILGVVLSLLLQQLAGLHFERHPWKRRLVSYAGLTALIVIGIVSHSLFTMFVNCLVQLLIGLVLLPGARRSAGGTSLFWQLLGLRRYLRTLEVDDIETLLENDPQYYYRALPYAEALGIGSKFTKKFTGFRLEPCHWLNWKGLLIENAEDFYHRFSLMLDEMDSKKR